jgi:hypothetical protein
MDVSNYFFSQVEYPSIGKTNTPFLTVSDISNAKPFRITAVQDGDNGQPLTVDKPCLIQRTDGSTSLQFLGGDRDEKFYYFVNQDNNYNYEQWAFQSDPNITNPANMNTVVFGDNYVLENTYSTQWLFPWGKDWELTIDQPPYKYVRSGPVNFRASLRLIPVDWLYYTASFDPSDSTKLTCQAKCSNSDMMGNNVFRWSCDAGTGGCITRQPNTLPQIYGTQADCQKGISGVKVRYLCLPGTGCMPVMGDKARSDYTSKAQCEAGTNKCLPTDQSKYACSSDKICYLNNNGQFASLDDCAKSGCSKPSEMKGAWKCDPGTCTCTYDPTANPDEWYATQSDCELNCGNTSVCYKAPDQGGKKKPASTISTGAIVAIILVVLLLVAVVGYFVYRSGQQRKKEEALLMAQQQQQTGAELGGIGLPPTTPSSRL